jgi:hypothetical protein
MRRLSAHSDSDAGIDAPNTSRTNGERAAFDPVTGVSGCPTHSWIANAFDAALILSICIPSDADPFVGSGKDASIDPNDHCASSYVRAKRVKGGFGAIVSRHGAECYEIVVFR